MDELVADFITETNESFEKLNPKLVTLEQNPNDASLINEIFRVVHTIKGTCGFLPLPRLEKLAHHGENVLERLRDGDLEASPENVALIFDCIDQIKYLIREIETSGVEPEGTNLNPIERLDVVASKRQEGAMKTQMQPIGDAWKALPRLVLDLSTKLNKKIDLEMIGQDIELDRQALESIKDPLIHMVRNSSDHGIEDTETRKINGKPETGTIILEASHESGHIIIQIKDDGRGLPMDLIKSKIISNDLATAEELAEMTDQQVQQHIFKAGFSTAENVTPVSGRGVGMDVVSANIEKIGGSIELTSREGFGSTFTIKIPLTSMM